MKNFLIGLMLVGTICGIAAAFLGLNYAARFYRDKKDAEAAREEAVKEKEKAKDDETYAERMRDEAERQKEVAERKQKDAEKKAEQSKKRAEAANQKRQKAEQEKEAMKEERDDALDKEKAALEARGAMDKERKKALGEAEFQKEARIIAEDKQDKALQRMGEANAEVVELRDLGKTAVKVVGFMGRFNQILFSFIDAGDKYLWDGLNDFGVATTSTKQQEALSRINEAKNKYLGARNKLKELESIDDQTREIIDYASESTKENIECVQIIHNTLRRMLRGSPGPKERKEKYENATKLKESADRRIVYVCDRLLDLIKTYDKAFTKAQQVQIQNLKKEIEERVKPQSSEETPSSTSPEEENESK